MRARTHISFLLIAILCLTAAPFRTQVLKSIIYDFDGFDLNSVDPPEGDYDYGDLSYQVTSNPLAASDVLGDRVLQLNLDWSAGYGAFGRGISRYIELSAQQDRLNFYFYNPVSNGQPALVEVSIADDDNNSKAYESGNDDSWRITATITASGSWQLVSLPLQDFSDKNAGGNGVFDIAFTQNKGMLLLTEFRFSQPAGTPPDAQFYIDMICLTEGTMPQGSGPLSLPVKQPGDHCLLGAHQKENPGEYYLIPSHFQSLFSGPPSKKIRYVNTYLQWATNGGTTAHALPGAGYQTLLNDGFRPVITWEPMFSGFSMTDPAQPNLTEISNGNYDAYLDAFGDKLKSYNDTIIVRLMHEFDGDWYPWCVATNQNDPQKFVNAFRHIVDRVRARGADKVLWMWCPNSDFAPQEHWNWIVSAYPGNDYVDIIGTDVYNAHYPSGLPWWRSFRWQTAEVYYYATKYFPSKPFFLCELACRERKPAEPLTSQSKADWFMMMDKDLQSYFRKTRALIFFSETKTQTWAVNTSSASIASLQANVWDDAYYFPSGPVSIVENKNATSSVFPNPMSGGFLVRARSLSTLTIHDAAGKPVMEKNDITHQEIDTSQWPPGLYFVSLKDQAGVTTTTRVIRY